MSAKKSKIYTRQGDDGYTNLADLARVSKADVRVEICATIDELNSYLGFAKSLLSDGDKSSELKSCIAEVQKQLFDVAAEVAVSTAEAKVKAAKISSEDIGFLEGLCDKYDEGLPPLKQFVIPGDTQLSAVLHIARTVARRVERLMVKCNHGLAGEAGAVCPGTLLASYMNRLSDLLFILARVSAA